MTSDATYQLRPATPADEPFLWEMLYQSLYVEEGAAPFPPEVVRQPELARYVAGWGRAGDLGVVAIESGGELAVGAAWSRLPGVEDKGFAYLDDETPELAVAVSPEHRGRGVGTALLKRLLSEASALFPAVALSVSPDNPARRLYERLGFETVEVRGGHPLMRKKLRP
jgi:ribosomal protein S18 acetylase RimI-like enzyme